MRCLVLGMMVGSFAIACGGTAASPDAACGSPNDVHNCRVCGRDCTMLPGVQATSVTCSNGECVIAPNGCAPNHADCDHNGVDGCEVDLTQPDSCGACGVHCMEPTPFCATTPGSAPRCASNCTAPANASCGGQCVDLQSDPNHCGSCNRACAVGPHQQAICLAGVTCTLTCEAGYGNCDGSNSNGCETALSSADHCGACSTGCSAPRGVCTTSTADGGVTAMCTCSPGLLQCSFACVDPQTDRSNCGGCGHFCPAYPNAGGTCSAGTCGIICTGGFGDCNHDPSDGCETELVADTNNCGACGTVCHGSTNASAACISGACRLVCVSGFGDCDHDASNGCELDLRSNVTSCGMCGTLCPSYANATPTCAASICGIHCNAGYSDCDGNTANGCETAGACP